MKHQNIIQTTLKREGRIISGKLEKINWGIAIDYRGNEIELKRGVYEELYLSEDFYICSSYSSSIDDASLYLFGEQQEPDNNKISYTFDTEERAIQVMELINSITVEEESKNHETNFCIEGDFYNLELNPDKGGIITRRKDNAQITITKDNFQSIKEFLEKSDELYKKEATTIPTACTTSINSFMITIEPKVKVIADKDWQELLDTLDKAKNKAMDMTASELKKFIKSIEEK